jgi:pyridoxamine 5'-phosphate oxidase
VAADAARPRIDDGELEQDPFVQLRRWHDEYAAAVGREARSAVLATAGPDGRASARWIDLTSVGDELVFFTSYGSRKAVELSVTPYATLCFGWPELERQARVEGPVERLGDLESDAHFATLPREAQILVWAADQGRVLAGRGELERRIAEEHERFDRQLVPRSRHWGGFRLVPDLVELWQGRADLAADRFRYSRSEDGWRLERLAP